MEIIFTKLTDEEHSVEIRRLDNSVEKTILHTRTFLRHDLSHLAVEIEVPLTFGFWGSVASGTPLTGAEIFGKEIGIAESLSGPVQTLMRVDAKVEQYSAILEQVQPHLASLDLAERIHERVRKLRGHWSATSYGGEMIIEWPEND
ncbi:hypothetical protein OAP18_02335 [Gammaproteobacteria bacterium]|nr:hypothetical protein [Gammaproteobacteria bacterium]